MSLTSLRDAVRFRLDDSEAPGQTAEVRPFGETETAEQCACGVGVGGRVEDAAADTFAGMRLCEAAEEAEKKKLCVAPKPGIFLTNHRTQRAMYWAWAKGPCTGPRYLARVQVHLQARTPPPLSFSSFF